MKVVNYIKNIFVGIWHLGQGMYVTMLNFCRPKVTQQYPENRGRREYGERFRALLTMPHDAENHHKCIACGKCVRECPRELIRIHECANPVVVKCSNRDPGKDARKMCEVSCIGCGLCQKACPWDMMSFDDEENKASKCFLCNGDPKCVKACPAAAIRYIPWTDRSHEEARRVPHGYLARENAAECSICHR